MTPKYWRIYTNKLWKAFSGHNDAIISIIICLGNHFDLDVILKKKKEKTKNTPPAHIPPHKKNKKTTTQKTQNNYVPQNTIYIEMFLFHFIVFIIIAL